MKSVRSAQPYRPNHPILCTDCHVYYDTIRDAILTCAQKLTQSQLNLPHGIEQLKSGKKEKVKKDMLRSIGIRGIREVSPVVASKERRRRSLAELRPVVSHGDWRKARFYPRDAMLARVLVMALSPSACLSVCLSVSLPRVGVLSNGMNRLIWFVARELLSTSPAPCSRKFRYLQNMGTSRWNFFLNSENFATVYRSSKRAINLAQ